MLPLPQGILREGRREAAFVVSGLARFIVEVIDGLDLGGMIGAYRGFGSAAHHPRMLLGVLIYG